MDLRRREASLTPKPFERLAKATGPALTEEAERLLRFIKPTAGSHAVRLADA